MGAIHHKTHSVAQPWKPQTYTRPSASKETPTPDGLRPPDDIVWAHHRADFFLENGDPSRVWSRSMIQADGGVIEGKEWYSYSEPHPRLVRPWSIIEFPHVDALEVSCHSEPVEEALPLPSDSSDDFDATSNISMVTAEFPMDVEAIENESVPETTIADVPKLEEHIPEYLLPDVLFVSDPRGSLASDQPWCSSDPSEKEPTPIKYKRTWPKIIKHDSSESLVAYLSMSTKIGTGHHSVVYGGCFRPPAPIKVASPTGEVRVAVKVPFDDRKNIRMLEQEGKGYAKMPTHLMENWTGYHHLEEEYGGDVIVPVQAVIPKFYGYYVPEDDDAWVDNPSRPLLLLEECGQPIETRKLSHEDREVCYSFATRLNIAGIFQNSFYQRNILAQPGPLHVRPSRRSMKTPSFRLIDFGRVEFESQVDNPDCDRVFQRRQAKEAIYGHVFS